MSDLKCKFELLLPVNTESAGLVSGQQLQNIPMSSIPKQVLSVPVVSQPVSITPSVVVTPSTSLAHATPNTVQNDPVSPIVVQNIPPSPQRVPITSLPLSSATAPRDSSELKCKLAPPLMGSLPVGASGLAALPAEVRTVEVCAALQCTSALLQQPRQETESKQESEQGIVIQQTAVSEQDTVQDIVALDQDTIQHGTIQQDTVNVKSEKESIQLISKRDTTVVKSAAALKPKEDITQQDAEHFEQDTMLQGAVQSAMLLQSNFILQDTMQSEQDAIQQVALDALQKRTLLADTEQLVAMQQATIQQVICASEENTTLQGIVQSELVSESTLLQVEEERVASQHVSAPAHFDGLEDYRARNLTQPVSLGSYCVEDKERDFGQEVSDDEIDADEMDAAEQDISEIDMQSDRGTELHPSVSELQPSISELQPSISELQSFVSELQPSISELRPSVSELQPSVQTSVSELQPSVSELQPSVSELQPSISELQPSLSELQPSVNELQPSAQPSVSELQPSIQPSVQPSVNELQPFVSELQPSVQPSVSELQPSVQPSVSELQPSVSELQPFVSGLQPSVVNELRPSLHELSELQSFQPPACEPQAALIEISSSITEPAFGSLSPSDCNDHIKAVEKDLTPVLKRQKLSYDEWTGVQTYDKAIQVPWDEELADDGYETVFQALPEECARQHALIPNVPPCRLSEADGLHSDERGDPPGDGGGWGVDTAGRSLEQSPSPPPQTALCDVHLASDQLVPEDSWNHPNTNQTLYPDAHADTKSNDVLFSKDRDVDHLGLPGVSNSYPPCKGASVVEQGSPVAYNSCFDAPTHTKQGTLGLGNLSKPRLRLGLSKRQKCRSLHDN